ncbi:hypothetical protein V6N13_136080 [Hibiscus sabdariffa]|uniref:Ferredoxin n=1 Tax=Hibiscus sabdariffa TaxID=183260 RepID=A0ABR2DPN9_9ROSI
MTTVSFTSSSIAKAATPNQFTSSIVKAPTYLGSVKTISKSFGMRCSSNHRTAMATYKIKLVGPKGEVNEFQTTEDEYILEAAEAAGVELPYCCRAGACSICTAKVVAGSVHQPDAIYLEDDQVKEGYMLTCVSKPTSDCEIHTHKELDLYSPSQ